MKLYYTSVLILYYLRFDKNIDFPWSIIKQNARVSCILFVWDVQIVQRGI